MRSAILALVTCCAASNMACAFMAPAAPGTDCAHLGVVQGTSTGPGLDPYPTSGKDEDRDAWKKNMQARYISLKTEAVTHAQKAALEKGATHIQYQEAMVTNAPNNQMNSSVNLVAYKCPTSTSFPSNSIPATDPVPEQHGSPTIR